jgi:pimeloyl-ACP methyl ester carboxylesterase
MSRPAPARVSVIVVAALAQDPAAERDAHLPDMDWSALPIGVSRDTFDSPSGPLAVFRGGAPERGRVVLVPGVTGSKEDFDLLFPPLIEQGYLVESYDMAGQYESHDAGPERLDPPRRHYDYDLFCAEMIAFLEAGATPAHLLGYSFAGIVAQLVAVRRPDLVRSLTLLSTPPLTGHSFTGVKWVGPISRVAPPAAGAMFMRWGLQLNVQHVPPGRQRFVAQRLHLTRNAAHADIMRLMQRTPDVRNALRGLGVPVAVAVGDHDLWPIELHREFASSIGASIAVYRTGHSPCETAPNQLTRDMLALFDKAGRAA